ncbi:hypothetical protein ACS8FD_24830, partial [Psychrobacter sp. 1U2]
METKDPALTKTLMTDDDSANTDLRNNDVERNDLDSDNMNNQPLSEESAKANEKEFHDSRDEIEATTSVNKGTDTFG